MHLPSIVAGVCDPGIERPCLIAAGHKIRASSRPVVESDRASYRVERGDVVHT